MHNLTKPLLGVALLVCLNAASIAQTSTTTTTDNTTPSASSENHDHKHALPPDVDIPNRVKTMPSQPHPQAQQPSASSLPQK